MHSFRYKGSELYCENVSLAALAKKHGTPLYVYSLSTIQDHYRKLDQALSPLDHQICYAMKANSNLAILRQIAQMGGGFDTVSAGEIFRVEKAGGDIRKCVFAGVGKTEEEIEYALRRKIGCFNVESLPELDRIDRVARKLRVKARIAVRVNPNVEAGGHKKITTGTYENKFGIAFEQVPAVYAHAAKLRNIEIYGLQMHIGSRIGEVAPFVAAVKKVIPLVKTLKAKHKTFTTFDIGGGIEIVYDHALASSDPAWWKSKTARKFLTPQEYAGHLVPLLKPLGLKIVIEPGRFIAGNAGVLLTEVQFVKKTGIKNFVIVDAAMNDLIRPALYESFHEIIPVKKNQGKTGGGRCRGARV
ncbi:diaminopimelate decarboxylase [Kamptonema cortianum]|nr:diaminopimelate decarboxylase [Kamptonema cortianum]